MTLSEQDDAQDKLRRSHSDNEKSIPSFRTPRHICSLVLPLSDNDSGINSGGVGESHSISNSGKVSVSGKVGSSDPSTTSNTTTSSLENVFIRQNSLKGRHGNYISSSTMASVGSKGSLMSGGTGSASGCINTVLSSSGMASIKSISSASTMGTSSNYCVAGIAGAVSAGGSGLEQPVAAGVGQLLPSGLGTGEGMGCLKRSPSISSVTSIHTSASQHTSSKHQTYSTSVASTPNLSSFSTNSSRNAATSTSTSNNHYPTTSFALPTDVHAGSPLRIAFEQYVLAPTSDGRAQIYQLADFQYAEHCMKEEREELNNSQYNNASSSVRYKNIANNHSMAGNIQNTKVGVKSICSLGPFYVGDHRPQMQTQIQPLPATLRKTNSVGDRSKKTGPMASIVDIRICDSDNYHLNVVGSIERSTLLGNLAILTLEGDVHLFECHQITSTINVGGSDNDMSISPSSTSLVNLNLSGGTLLANNSNTNTNINASSSHIQLKVEHVVSYSSGGMGNPATSLAIFRSVKEVRINVMNSSAGTSDNDGLPSSGSGTCTSTGLRQYQAEIWIAVGFETGVVVEHAVLNKRQVLLRWRGCLECPIRSIGYIYNDSISSKKEHSTASRRLYLVVGVSVRNVNYTDANINAHKHKSDESVDDRYDAKTTSPMPSIDVIDTDVITHQWSLRCKKSKRKKSTLSSTFSSNEIIKLSEYSVWPTNIFKDIVKLKKVIESPTISVVDIICLPKQHMFTIVLSNGITAAMEYWFTSDSCGEMKLRWGLRNPQNMVTQPYPGIGAGIFQTRIHQHSIQQDRVMSLNDNPFESPPLGHVGTSDIKDVDTKTHNLTSIACCTRGGTISIFPVPTQGLETTTHKPRESSITPQMLFHILSDTGMDDGSIPYIQGFTAGHIRVRSWGRRTNSEYAWNFVPVLIVALQGGIIDCYTFDDSVLGSSDPHHSSYDGRRERLLAQLSMSGALEQLLLMLSLFDDDHITNDSIEETLLKKASQEVKISPISADALHTRIKLNSLDGFESLSDLLYRLVLGKSIS